MSGPNQVQRLASDSFLCILGFAIAAGSASGQPIVYTREFKMLQGVAEPSAAPMAFHSTGIFVAGAFQAGGFTSQAFLRRYDRGGNELWTRPMPASGDVFPLKLAVTADGTAVVCARCCGPTGLSGYAATVGGLRRPG